MPDRKLRIGVAGIGRAFSIMQPAFADPRWQIVAGADPRPEARERFSAEYQASVYPTVEEMCADFNVDAVYIATPHQFHRENVAAAARHKTHVLVEKPMALTLDDCQAMIDAARAAGIVMIVGHSHSFDAPIARARSLIRDGTLGAVRMITAAYHTDFLYRPRRAEEMDTAQGGGVMYNQAPHQVDVVRLLGGGKVATVRAVTGAWDEARRTEGAYQALLTFENGATATLTYSGYAHFVGDELVDMIAESGLPRDPNSYGATRKALADLTGPDAEERLKTRNNYGSEGYSGSPNASKSAKTERAHQHFGLVVACCEHGDLRPTAKGVHVYGDTERRFEALPPPRIYRDEVVDEFYRAVIGGEKPVHDGEWGMATMEVCLAMLQSAREGREITLRHQVVAGDER